MERDMTRETLARAFGTAKRAKGEDRAFEVIASTEDVDGHGTVIDQASWKLDRYKANPCVFWNHRTSANIFDGGETSDEIPIARAENIRVKSGQLRARIVFPAPGASELADRVCAAVADGRVSGVSVGFRPGRVAKETIDGVERFRLFDCELFEVSLCGLPSNAKTIVQRSLDAARAALQSAPAPRTERAPEIDQRSVAVVIREALELADDASTGAMVAAIAKLRSLAAKGEHAEALQRELDRWSDLEIDFIIARGRDYGLREFTDADRPLLKSYRRSDPAGFAETYAIPLAGLRACDDPRLFRNVAGPGGLMSASVDAMVRGLEIDRESSANAESDEFDRRVALWRQAKKCTESEAIDAVLHNRDR